MTPKTDSASTLSTLYHLTVFDIKRRYRVKVLLHEFQEKYGTSKKDLNYFKTIIEKQLIMSQRVVVLEAVSKVFHWWHVIHKPFAYAIFLVLVLHIVLTMSLGFTWIL
jgi:hypothetical protein